MRIICTVRELAYMLRGCAEHRRYNTTCGHCPFVDLCKDDYIEQFVAAGDIVEEDAKSENA